MRSGFKLKLVAACKWGIPPRLDYIHPERGLASWCLNGFHEFCHLCKEGNRHPSIWNKSCHQHRLMAGCLILKWNGNWIRLIVSASNKSSKLCVDWRQAGKKDREQVLYSCLYESKPKLAGVLPLFSSRVL
jgi:hypothetical protein